VNALGLCIGDGNGAPEFRRQSAAWQQWMFARGYGADLFVLDVATRPLAYRFGRVVHCIADNSEPFRQVAVFCHGWSTGLQLVPRQSVAEFAAAIRRHELAPGCIVTLYACSAGSDTLASTSEMSGAGPGGDGGFADRLRDALCAAGDVHCRVDAHSTPGHLARNPYVRRFEGGGSASGGIGGQWLVTPKSAHWAAWRKALAGDLRWEFPHLTAAEIHARLATL